MRFRTFQACSGPMREVYKALQVWFAACLLAVGAPLAAATPREMLIEAVFQANDKAHALALIDAAKAEAENQLASNPRDREAEMQRAVAIGHRAHLTHSPAGARTARRLFEAYLAANPRDPEAHLAVATWHLDTVDAGLIATTLLGGSKEAGLAELDKAVALGGGRPFFTGFAALMRIRLNTRDVAMAHMLAEQAAVAPAPTQLDRIARHAAQAILLPLRAGDGRAAALLARKLLPLGRL